ncbi:MAG: DNRLRE domain-containing protein [Planctomycetota bacterium]|nr:MAG: DNRLRE domain-containing protein [Planctomycetota bacterium]
MRLRRTFLPVAFALVASASALAQAQTTTRFQDGAWPSAAYRNTRDTIIKEGAQALNFGDLDRLRVTTADIGPAGPTWTLLRWDLSAHVPPGAIVRSARITLTVLPTDTGPTNDFYELRRPWTEGDSTPGSGATWLTSDGSTPWQTAGAEGALDRGTTVLGSIGGGLGPQTANLNAAGVALVQRWVDDPQSNYGLVLRGSSPDGVDYASREAADPSERPLLEVTWELPPLPFGPTQVVLQNGVGGYAGTTDAWIDARDPNRNRGNGSTLRTDATPARRTLLRFDLGSLAPGTRLTGATLRLFVNNTGNDAEVYALRRAFVEGQATWNQAAAANPWQVPGADGAADRDTTLLGTLSGGATGYRDVVLNAAGLAEMQGWIDAPATNFGFVLLPSGGNDLRFRSSERNPVSERPQLILDVQPAQLKLIGGGSDWDDPAAWSPPGLPGPGDVVEVRGPGTVTKSAAATSSVDRLRVVGAGELRLDAGRVEVAGLTTVEDGALSCAGGTLRAAGPLLALPGTRVELAGAGAIEADGVLVWIGGTLRSNGGTLAAVDLARRMDVRVKGALDLDGLTFRGGDAEGLEVADQAQVLRLRKVRFEAVAPGAGSRHLSIAAPRLDLNAPGLWFDALAAGQFNLSLTDTEPSSAEDVIVNLEDRGAGANGPGVGAAFEQQLGGAEVNWVHAAPDTTRGVGLGFPQVAWDLNTFAEYATYAAFRDVDGLNTADRIHVFDAAGDGVDAGYWFEVPAADGDIVGFPWWDQLPSGEHVVWAVTNLGRVFRWTNPGSGVGALPPDPGFPQIITDGGQPVVFTSSPISDSQSYLFVAGTTAGSPRFYALDFLSGRLDPAAGLGWVVSAGLSYPVTTQPSLEFLLGFARLFVGGGTLGGPGVTLFQESFDSGPGSFVYRDDAFRGTNAPDAASGNYTATGGRSGGGLRVLTGPNAQGMSGAWETDFTVSGAPPLVQVSLSYRLILDERHEFDEFADLLVAVDGVLYGTPPNDYVVRLVGDGNGGPDHDTGWQTFTFFAPLGDGTHRLSLGHFHNKSTEFPEIARSFFDDVVVSTTTGDGVIYRIDTQTRLIDVTDTSPTQMLVGSPFPAFGTGLFLGDAAGTVYGFDQDTMTPLPGGWPVNPGGGPLQGSVWVDFTAGQVFWGNEAGQVHGYSVAGTPLPGFPLVSPFGDGSPVRDALASDGAGVLWVGTQGGRLGAFDVSTGNPVGPVYRLGRDAPLAGLAQDFRGHFQVVTPKGKLIVVDAPADPTP